MKHYSLYEIEKLTDGKLSKYRLKQAIKEGFLKATYTNPERRGPGSPSYIVESEDLDAYLTYLKKSKPTKIEIDNSSKTELEELKLRVEALEKEANMNKTFLRTFMEEALSKNMQAKK